MNAFILTIDVEPEDRAPLPGRRPDWEGFPLAIDQLARLRRLLSSSSGREVNFSWFIRVDPSIATVYGDAAWAIRRYSSELRALEAAGDSIGLHVHPFRWSDADGTWTNDYGDFDWVRHCLDVGAQEFRQAWGASPRVFRFGDHWMSNEAVGELERHGIEIDLTVEPGMRCADGMVATERNTAGLPDMRRVPRQPYQPDRHDYQKRPLVGRPRPLWMLPVTTGYLAGSPLMGRLTGTADRVHLNFALRAAWMQPLLDEVLRREGRLVVSVARTGDLIAPESIQAFEWNIEYLASHPRTASRHFITPLSWKRDHTSSLAAGFTARLSALLMTEQ